jgi:hypothetical protein
MHSLFPLTSKNDQSSVVSQNSEFYLTQLKVRPSDTFSVTGQTIFSSGTCNLYSS